MRPIQLNKHINALFLVFALVVAGVSAFAFPQIAGFKNSPIVVFENKKRAEIKKDLFLKSPFVVVTETKDQFTFNINNLDKVVVYPDSKVQVLEFADEVGTVPELYLLSGQIRYSCDHRSAGQSSSDSNVVLRTPFFDLKTNFTADILIDLNMNEPSVEVKVISGAILLEFFAFEDVVKLGAGQKIKFKGFLTEDRQGIQYDFLLNRRKVPKGELGKVQKFDQSSFVEAEKKVIADEAQKIKMKKLAEEERKRKQKEYEDSFLCKKPFGQKDQCAWWLENGKCYRKRCNVNAHWGDDIERPVTDKCKADFTVGECDY